MRHHLLRHNSTESYAVRSTSEGTTQPSLEVYKHASACESGCPETTATLRREVALLQGRIMKVVLYGICAPPLDGADDARLLVNLDS